MILINIIAKRVIIIVVLFVLVNPSFSQADSSSAYFKMNHKLFFAISGGLAVPFAEFAEYEPSGSASFYTGTNYAGPPKIGFFGKAEFMYSPLKNLGIICTYYSTVNKADTLSQNAVFPPPPVGSGGLGNHNGGAITSFLYKTRYWSTNSILLGIAPQLNYDLVKIRFKLSGGVQQARTPETRIDERGYNAIFSYPNNFTTTYYTSAIIQPSMTSYNFVFSTGLDIRFCLKKRLGMIIGVDCLISYANFTGNLIDQSGNKTPNSFSKDIYLYLFSIGLCYEIK